MNNNFILCIVGRTCSGKDTLTEKLLEDFPLDFSKFISYTDRPMRMGESDGVEHWFVTKKEFDKALEISSPIAYTEIKSEINPDGYRYMCVKDQLSRHNTYIIDPNGIKYLIEKHPEIDLGIIYVKIFEDVREERAKKRSDYPLAYQTRCEQENQQFTDFENLLPSKIERVYDRFYIDFDSKKDIPTYFIDNSDELNKAYAHFSHAALDLVEYGSIKEEGENDE